MAREKFQTLTEQMFYILLCLQTECYGMDMMEKIHTMTHERVTVGPGTLYHLLEAFEQAGMIRETKVTGRRRSYLITDTGRRALETEYQRLKTLAADYRKYGISKGENRHEDDKAQI
ncbi:MAG: PadR family transcriptional regulator [Oscillospiraceae bacterium]|nr:PadR family transcriptional regulator [Oscillospiraceae bacterium]